MILPEKKDQKFVSQFVHELRDYNNRLFLACNELCEVGKGISKILVFLAKQSELIEQEMKKFEEGFAYERPKTTSSSRKKPVLHGMEPQRNKRKPNKASKYADSSL